MDRHSAGCAHLTNLSGTPPTHPNPTNYQRLCTAGGNLVMSLGQKSWSQGAGIKFFFIHQTNKKSPRNRSWTTSRVGAMTSSFWDDLYFENMTIVKRQSSWVTSVLQVFSRSLNDTSRVVRIMIIGDITTWSITYNRHSDYFRGVIYYYNIFIIQATGLLL